MKKIFTILYIIISISNIYSEEVDLLESLDKLAIIKDIETSTLLELNQWAKSLGLSTGTNEESIRNNIAKYYNVELLKQKEVKKDKVITINRAELSNYYTQEVVDESIAEFEGRVEIIIDDSEKKIQHSVIADKINFNRTTNNFTAIGNVEYVKTEQGKPELVTAESLTFNISNWKGSLIQCISKQEKTINKEEMTFYYVSGEIKKSDTEVMGMRDVTIQTVIGSPYFNISALDLWMLDSSDFVIVLPSIKVGHVPVFIAPFYYHTDNNLYFNPVYGVRSREGTTLQNTIYLMGKKIKNEEESDFSFLSFENGETPNNYELNGLSLIPSDDKNTYSKDYSKLMIDYYSNLGLFLGNESEISFKSINSIIKLESGLGFSRNINETTGDVFVNNESEWNSSFLLDYELPFRYLFSLNLDLPFGVIDFKTYSDPYVKTDFYNRTENFQWIDYFTDQMDQGLSFTGDSSIIENYSRDSDEVPNITSYNWGVDFKTFNPNIETLKPYITNISLDINKIKIDMNSKVSKELNDSEQLIDQYESYDPQYKFFYPEKISLPLKFLLSGSILDTSYIKETNNKKEEIKLYKYEDSIFNIENPLKKDSTNNKQNQTPTYSIFEVSDNNLFKDEKIEKIVNNNLSSKITYNFNIPINIYTFWDNSEWNNQEDIEYNIDNDMILYNFDPTAEVIFKLEALNSFFTINNSIKSSVFYKQYAEDQEQSDLLDTYKWNKTLLENKLSLKLDIFKLFPNIQNNALSINYELNTDLYKRAFDQDTYDLDNTEMDVYYNEYFEWSDDFVKKHNLLTEYKYDIDFSETIISLNFVLDPLVLEQTTALKQNFEFKLLKEFTNKNNTTIEYVSTTDDDDEIIEKIMFKEFYSINWKGITTSIDSGFNYSESFIDLTNNTDEWDISNLNFKVEYLAEDLIKVYLNSEYSLEEDLWEKYSAGISLFGFDISLSSSYNKPVIWEDLKWVTQTDEEEKLLLNNLVVKQEFKLENFIFWKNRVSIDLSSNLSFNKEFINLDKSSFKYDLIFDIDIYNFLSLKFSSTSSNNSMFQYWESDSEILGINSKKNIFVDLFKSFNFLSEEDRSESSFNLYSISLEATYIMPDWNLIFEYTGKPKLEDEAYEWYQVFSFFIEWKPLSLVRSDIKNEDENWSASTNRSSE